MTILYIILQALLFIGISPLISGIINKIKNNLRMKKGASIFQPYFNIIKLFSKDETVSKNTSWIFTAAPYILLSSTIAASLLVPLLPVMGRTSSAGDFVALLFIFLTGRFFLSLAALDSASTFSGMGGSREMFVSSFAEPCALLAVFALSIKAGTTNLFSLASAHPFDISTVMAFLAMFMVALAETSRLPVDNQETHLELTMIHEAMLLEYSGPSLAMIEMSVHIKQMIWFVLLSVIIGPSLIWMLSAFVIIPVMIAFSEIINAKMRLFRLVDYFAFSFVLAAIAAVCAVLGV